MRLHEASMQTHQETRQQIHEYTLWTYEDDFDVHL